MSKKVLNRKKENPLLLTFTGNKYSQNINAQLYKYNKDKCVVANDYSLKGFKNFKSNDYRYWLNIYGLHDITTLKMFCKKLGVHDLAIQDILDVNQRPKFQNYDDHWFFTIKSLQHSNESVIIQEQLSFILGNNFLVSFQEKDGDNFEHIRQRLKRDIGIVRERSTDYLLFLLLESILDNYFKTIDSIENKMEAIEFSSIENDPTPGTLNIIELYKRQIHQIKKTIIPIRDFVLKIERDEFSFIKEKHVKYYYEIKDLCYSLIDNCDNVEIRLESNINLFFSIQGNRMNQVMKTLTIVSAIFIPSSFIAGIYGMNFHNMPELAWRWGYAMVWTLILTISIILFYFFKKNKWF